VKDRKKMTVGLYVLLRLEIHFGQGNYKSIDCHRNCWIFWNLNKSPKDKRQGQGHHGDSDKNKELWPLLLLYKWEWW